MTSLDTLQAVASSLVARWHHLDDAGRLALLKELELAVMVLHGQAARHHGDDHGSDQGSVIDNPLSLLTPREFEVLQAIAEGKTTRVIAAHLAITPLTVRSHVKSLLRKLGVHSRLEAASVFLRFQISNVTDVG